MSIFHKCYLRNIYLAVRRVWYRQLSTCKRVEGEFHLLQAGLMNGNGRIIGHGAHIGYYPSDGLYNSTFYLEARNADAVIELGRSYYNNGFCAIAENGRITIGDDCLIGTRVCILNSDFHSSSIARRHAGGGGQ